MLTLLAQSTQPNPVPPGFMAFFGVIWCGAILIGLAQFVLAIICLIQILKRPAPGVDKLLWCLVIWFVPVIGSILWWTIGSKQLGKPSKPQPPGDWP